MHDRTQELIVKMLKPQIYDKRGNAETDHRIEPLDLVLKNWKQGFSKRCDIKWA